MIRNFLLDIIHFDTYFICFQKKDNYKKNFVSVIRAWIILQKTNYSSTRKIIVERFEGRKRGKKGSRRRSRRNKRTITNNTRTVRTNRCPVKMLLLTTRGATVLPCSTSSDLSSRNIAFVAAKRRGRREHVRFTQLSHNDSLVSPVQPSWATYRARLRT